jgi:hypothetical protein
MLPHDVDPGWYDAYWWTDRPRKKRRSLAGSLARFAVLIVLLAGGGMALSYFHVHSAASAASAASGAQDWEQE